MRTHLGTRVQFLLSLLQRVPLLGEVVVLLVCLLVDVAVLFQAFIHLVQVFDESLAACLQVFFKGIIRQSANSTNLIRALGLLLLENGTTGEELLRVLTSVVQMPGFTRLLGLDALHVGLEVTRARLCVIDGLVEVWVERC